MLFTRALFFVSVIAGALAQTTDVSPECQNAVVTVAGSPQAACLNPTDLIQVFIQGSTNSVIPSMDTWLRGLCSRGPCSNDDIAFVVTSITTGCASDLQPYLGTTPPETIVPLVQQIYPTFRKAACLADASASNQICVIQTLSNIETATGPLTFDQISAIATAIASGQDPLSGVNLCTPCNKQIFNVLRTDFPETFGQGDSVAEIQASCGPSFVDGASDPNIVQTATG
jgi:hypothetical protein